MSPAAKDVEPYLDQIKLLPFVKAVHILASKSREKPDAQIDATLVLETDSGSHRFACEVTRTHVSREAAQRFIHLARELPELLVLAPAIGRDIGDLFERERVNFIDLAGNCHVRISDRYVARIQGRKPVSAPVIDKGLRAPSYRVLFVLLVNKELVDASARGLAQASGNVSPQTANDLRARLVELGLVLRTKAHHRWAPRGWKQGLELWLAGFTTTLFPSLITGRFRAKERDMAALESRLAQELGNIGSWRWGGGAAAQRLTHYYRGDRTIVYMAAPPSDVAKRLLLVPDPSGPVLIASSPGPMAFTGPCADTVHPLLVYADLLAEGHDRASDAAGEIHARFLTEGKDNE